MGYHLGDDRIYVELMITNSFVWFMSQLDNYVGLKEMTFAIWIIVLLAILVDWVSEYALSTR